MKLLYLGSDKKKNQENIWTRLKQGLLKGSRKLIVLK